jgi:hypothetical protein
MNTISACFTLSIPFQLREEITQNKNFLETVSYIFFNIGFLDIFFFPFLPLRLASALGLFFMY